MISSLLIHPPLSHRELDVLLIILNTGHIYSQRGGGHLNACPGGLEGIIDA